jgi:ubiquitin carboxyl-terminal hydrolase 14
MKVNVKWGKQLFKDVDVDMDAPPEQLKMQLFSLSGVPIERQKVMGKGGMLQNDSWGKVTLKEGQTIIMMGTADELPKAATEAEVKFVEDLPEEVRGGFIDLLRSL